MHRLVYNLSCDNRLLEKTLEQISYRTGGIRKRFVKTDSGEIVESISYKSLLSLMYYELFLDIKMVIFQITVLSAINFICLIVSINVKISLKGAFI